METNISYERFNIQHNNRLRYILIYFKKSLNILVMENTGNKRKENLLTGLFKQRSSAVRAYNRLYERGFSEDEINIMMTDETRKRYFDKKKDEATKFGNKAMEGAAAGSAIGGTIGATVGIIAALGSGIIIPDLGIVVAGPLAAGLAGAGAGGLTGGIVGALIGSGLPEEKAKKYVQEIKKGKIVMGVRPRNKEEASYLEEEWYKNQGEDIYR